MDNRIQMQAESTSRAVGRGVVSASVSITATATVHTIKVRVLSTVPVPTYESVRENYLTYYSGPGSLSAGGLASDLHSNAVTATASNDAVAFALGVNS